LKPIRIVTAAGPGGGVDTTSRIIAQNLQDAAVTKILHAPDVAKKLASIGLEPVGQGLAESDAYIKSEIRKWAGVVKAAGISAN